MQQTQKYKLNLIESSDPFLPDGLNQNTQKVEDIVAAIDADNAAQRETLTAAVERFELENLWVKLASAVGTADNQQIDFDLSCLDMSKYSALLVLFSCGRISEQRPASATMMLNGTVLTGMGGELELCGGVTWLFPNPGGIVYTNVGSGEYTKQHNHGLNLPNILWDQLHTLSVKGTYKAGATVHLYALK